MAVLPLLSKAAAMEAVSSFCNLRQSVFPFSGQLRACEGVGQDGDKVLVVHGLFEIDSVQHFYLIAALV